MELNKQLREMENRLGASPEMMPEMKPMNRPPSPTNKSNPTATATANATTTRQKPGGKASAGSRPPGFRPERKNRTYTPDEQIKMRRDNVSLLSNLERIQRRGGGTNNTAISPAVAKTKAKHTAASSINRFKTQTKTANENMAFLKRLQGVKSSGIGGTPKRGGKTLAGTPPPGSNGKAKVRKAKKPEWVDSPVGPMPKHDF
jgi:hypothetical protein